MAAMAWILVNLLPTVRDKKMLNHDKYSVPIRLGGVILVSLATGPLAEELDISFYVLAAFVLGLMALHGGIYRGLHFQIRELQKRLDEVSEVDAEV